VFSDNLNALGIRVKYIIYRSLIYIRNKNVITKMKIFYSIQYLHGLTLIVNQLSSISCAHDVIFHARVYSTEEESTESSSVGL